MPLSTMPTGLGPTIPDGCTNVKVTNTRGANAEQEITVLTDDERKYRAAILADTDQTVVTFSFMNDTWPTVTPVATKTGWICYEVEVEWSVGEVVKGTASYTNVPAFD